MDEFVLVCEHCGKEYEYHEEQEECLHTWKPIPLLMVLMKRAINSGDNPATTPPKKARKKKRR